MKMLVAIICAGLWTMAWSAEESEKNPPKTMPREVTLTTGRVLRNVQVIRWEGNRVVLRHSGGADPVTFNLFRIPTPAELATIRDSANIVQSAKTQDEVSVYEGKVSIVSKDRGPRSIEGAIIYVLPEEAWLRMQSNLQPVLLPKPINILRSDQNGRFNFTTERGLKFVILAQGSLAIDMANIERYEWRLRSMSFSPGEEIQLNADNDSGVVREYKVP